MTPPLLDSSVPTKELRSSSGGAVGALSLANTKLAASPVDVCFVLLIYLLCVAACNLHIAVEQQQQQQKFVSPRGTSVSDVLFPGYR